MFTIILRTVCMFVNHRMMRKTNRERSEATRAVLIGSARELFAERGYAETSTPEIVAAANVTRGALYHHFADKRALFHAVVVEEAAAIAAAIHEQTSGCGSAIEALKVGGRAFLEAMTQPGRARLLLIEAPAVLGAETLAEIDGAQGGRTLIEGLRSAIAEGAIAPLPVEPLAALLSAAFDRAAFALSQGDDSREWAIALDALIDGLVARSRADLKAKPRHRR